MYNMIDLPFRRSTIAVSYISDFSNMFSKSMNKLYRVVKAYNDIGKESLESGI